MPERIEIKPDSVDDIRDLRVKYARLLLQAGKAPEAEARLRGDLAKEPANVELRWELANALLALGRTREYIDLLKELTTLRPDWPQARLNLARTMIHQGFFAEAEAVLRKSPGQGSADWEEHFLLARLLNQLGRLDEAHRAFRKAHEAAPDRIEIGLAWCETFQRLGKTPELLTMLRRIKKNLGHSAPTDLDGWVDRFRLSLCACDYDEAFRLGEEILKMNPKLEQLEHLRWPNFIDEFDLTYASAAYHRLACRELDRHVKAHPLQPWGYYYRALIVRSLSGKKRRVTNRRLAADFSKIARLAEPRHAWMKMQHTKHLLTAREFGRAYEGFRQMARFEHWIAECHSAEALLCQGNVPAALAVFDAAERTASDFARANVLAWKGAANLWIGEYATALDLLEKATRGAAQYAHCWRGGALVMLGRCEEALPVLNKAVAVSPWDLEAKIWRGEAFYRLGRHSEAILALDSVRSNCNHYAQVVRGLARAVTGDVAGLRKDFSALYKRRSNGARQPLPELRCALNSLYLDSAATDAQRTAVLEKLLALSCGVRRWDYTTSVWLAVNRATTPRSRCENSSGASSKAKRKSAI